VRAVFAAVFVGVALIGTACGSNEHHSLARTARAAANSVLGLTRDGCQVTTNLPGLPKGIRHSDTSCVRGHILNDYCDMAYDSLLTPPTLHILGQGPPHIQAEEVWQDTSGEFASFFFQEDPTVPGFGDITLQCPDGTATTLTSAEYNSYTSIASPSSVYHAADNPAAPSTSPTTTTTPAAPSTSPTTTTTSVAGAPCTQAALMPVLRDDSLRMWGSNSAPPGTTASAPVCSGGWAIMEVNPDSVRPEIALFRVENNAWQLVDEGGSQFRCAGHGVPPADCAAMGWG
jgi:hypothetical protein